MKFGRGAVVPRGKAYQRLSRLPSADVIAWAEQAGTGMSRALDDYRRHGTQESLQEARTGLEALQAVLDLLQERHGV